VTDKRGEQRQNYRVRFRGWRLELTLTRIATRPSSVPLTLRVLHDGVRLFLAAMPNLRLRSASLASSANVHLIEQHARAIDKLAAEILGSRS
jgi:hypothetical protein